MGNWQNGVTALNEDNMNALYDLRKGGTYIAADTDLNDLTTPGTYRVDNSTVAATLTNCPVSSGYFKMIVEHLHSDQRIRQTIYHSNTSSDTYVRSYAYGDAWGSWKKITDADNSYYLGLAEKNIDSNTDLNDLTTIGTYKCTMSSVLATLLNLPDGVSSTFKLIVENTSTSTNYRQTIHVNGNYALSFVRSYGGNSWGVWKQTTGISSLSETATTNADGYFGSGVNKANDIVSVTVMPTSGGAALSGQVYTKSDVTNHRIYVYNPDGTLAINTEVSYRIKYIVN